MHKAEQHVSLDNFYAGDSNTRMAIYIGCSSDGPLEQYRQRERNYSRELAMNSAGKLPLEMAELTCSSYEVVGAHNYFCEVFMVHLAAADAPLL